MESPIFLDINVFMYAAGKPHPYKNPCLHILKDVENRALSAIVNTEIFQELLYRYSHIGLLDKGVQLCRDILEYPLDVLSVTQSDIRFALDLAEKYKHTGMKPRDVISMPRR